MKVFIGLLVGVLIGAAAYWFFTEGQKSKSIRQAQRQAADGAERMGGAIREEVGKIRAEDVKEELARTGRVIRRKAVQAGEAFSDATANIRTTTRIKAKLVADSRLSALDIGVDTTDGLVTLSGTVASHEDIARAVELALETDGVRQVISTLQVRAPK